jgi:hypothetical protein
MPVDEARIDRAANWLAGLDAKARGEPPALTPVEKAAMSLSGGPVERGALAAADVERAVRYLLDERQGAAWCGPRTTMAAALALLEVRRIAGPTEGGPLPLRIRVGDELVAAVTLSPEELAAGGRVFSVGPDALPEGPLVVTFEAGREVDADVAARLTWHQSAPGGQVNVYRKLHILTEGSEGTVETLLEERARTLAPGEVLGIRVNLIPFRAARGPVVVTCPIPSGSTHAPGRAGSWNRVAGPGVVHEPDRVRFFLERLPGAASALGHAVRFSWTGKFRLRPVEIRDLETGELIGVSWPNDVEVR